MNVDTKITLSKKEWHAIKNTDFFLQKRKITEKIFHSYANMVKAANRLRLFSGLSLPEGTDVTTGKISKGDNYLGLPYIVLDYPKKFSTEDVLAIRTMFWWGNFVSCTLVLGGNSAAKYRPLIKKKYGLLKKTKAYICLHESPWQHHFEKDNYTRVSKLTKKQFEKHIESHAFIKIAAKIPVSKMDRMEKFILKQFVLYKEVLSG